MNFIEKITGSDMTRDFKLFEARIKKLPTDYQNAWEEIKNNLWLYGNSNFSGRNLMPIFANIVDLLETTVSDGQSAKEVFGDDIKGFCLALSGEKKSYRDKWREQLNNNIAKNLGGLE